MDAMQQFLPLLGQDDPMGTATAALEARRRQQIEGAGYDPDQGLYDRYSAMLGSVLGSTIAERAGAAREAMRRGDMASANALSQSLALDFGQFLGSIKPIRAYHGSPHDFDRFDMSKIGTGEGAQAYGHGLYFAENEGVARSYRANLARPKFATGFDDLDRMLDEAYQQIARQSQLPVGASDAADLVGERLARQRADALKAGDMPWFDQVSDMQIAIRRMKEAPPEIPGRMYEVNIHADPKQFLDWDAPLSAQSDKARAALADMKPEWTGGQIYESSRLVPGDFMDKRAAASALRERGIPGIKYLDQGSRAAGDGSRNYVVFDDKLIEILRKYGLLPPVAAGGAAALSSEAEAAP